MEDRIPPTEVARAKRGFKPGKLIFPIAVMLFIGFFLKEQFPQVDSWLERMFKPEVWQAREACRKQAIQSSATPDFTRLLSAGEVHNTQNGLYIKSIQYGEMTADGKETIYRFSCWLDSNGTIVKSHREAAAQ